MPTLHMIVIFVLSIEVYSATVTSSVLRCLVKGLLMLVAVSVVFERSVAPFELTLDSIVTVQVFPVMC
jgi:hypothetical protein